jgi:hypothetical protein
MAHCIHGTHWDGASAFFCPQCEPGRLSPQNCEECGAISTGTPDGPMPYLWTPGSVRWLCGKCAPAAYARHVAAREALAKTEHTAATATSSEPSQ